MAKPKMEDRRNQLNLMLPIRGASRSAGLSASISANTELRNGARERLLKDLENAGLRKRD